MDKAKLIIKIITNLLLVCYPFIIYLSFKYQYINLAVWVLMIFFVLRFISLPNLFSSMRWLAKTLAIMGILLAVSSWLFAKYQLLLYYPVMVNMIFLLLFSYSLSQPQTIIEKFARMQHSDLPIKAVQYTRKVTICWCLFFVINGSIALTTCLINDMYWWTIYNGLISYLLMAILMGVEWLIRQKLQH
ncbi:hypothetical protein A9G35_04505 [Gilliamella sp. Choc5-1]|nr:hypothetical protein A9G35_04505 [Gilliamella apicola]